MLCFSFNYVSLAGIPFLLPLLIRIACSEPKDSIELYKSNRSSLNMLIAHFIPIQSIHSFGIPQKVSIHTSKHLSLNSNQRDISIGPEVKGRAYWLYLKPMYFYFLKSIKFCGRMAIGWTPSHAVWIWEILRHLTIATNRCRCRIEQMSN